MDAFLFRPLHINGRPGSHPAPPSATCALCRARARGRRGTFRNPVVQRLRLALVACLGVVAWPAGEGMGGVRHFYRCKRLPSHGPHVQAYAELNASPVTNNGYAEYSFWQSVRKLGQLAYMCAIKGR